MNRRGRMPGPSVCQPTKTALRAFRDESAEGRPELVAELVDALHRDNPEMTPEMVEFLDADTVAAIRTKLEEM